MPERGCDMLNEASDRTEADGARVRAELCWKCGNEWDDPASEPADMLDRGDDAAADIDGREESRREVSVAAAWMSISISAVLPSDSWISSCFPLPLAPPFSRVGLLPLDLVGELCAARDDLLALREGEGACGFAGAGTGGS